MALTVEWVEWRVILTYQWIIRYEREKSQQWAQISVLGTSINGADYPKEKEQKEEE